MDDFRSDVGRTSSEDDLDGLDETSLTSSSTLNGAKVSSVFAGGVRLTSSG